MSLICTKCEEDMGPSESLPGREGVFISPNLISLVPIPQIGESIEYALRYTEQKINRSLCFECLDRKIPDERRKALQAVYDSYEAETEFEMFDEESMRGRMIELGGREDTKSRRLDAEYRRRLEVLSMDCIFCGEDVENGEPFFRARVIDKVYSRNHLSGSSWVGTNYSFSNIRTGSTSLRFCYRDLSRHFPEVTKRLSYDIMGQKDASEKGVFELYIDPSFEAAVEEQGGDIGEMIRDLTKGVGKKIKIIRVPKNKDKLN